MSKITQGTQIYFIDPTGNTLVTVDCATTFNPGGSPADQIETTCLEATEREYVAGLRTPGQASMSVNADPTNTSHVRMHELSEANPQPVLSWAVGWSDGTAAPTVDTAGDFILPTTRTWFTFQGYISDFPFDFQLNAVVTSAITIQRSGGSAWVRKV